MSGPLPEFPAELFVRRTDDRGEALYLSETVLENHCLDFDIGTEHRLAIYRLDKIVNIAVKTEITDLDFDDVERIAAQQK